MRWAPVNIAAGIDLDAALGQANKLMQGTMDFTL